ncbi:MAG: PA0069 family radical SAM protein [Chthoniobacteraceae bacterium]
MADSSSMPAPAGRGADVNTPNRFEAHRIELEPDALVDDDGQPLPLRTQFFRDDSRSILSWNDSPDIPFRVGCSPYRGCEHGCAYCFARPTHEYLGLSAGLDFESRIIVKERAPDLLRSELSKKSWEPQTVAMSGVTDVYQPVERRLGLTRRCLEVFADFRNPVAIITKNHLVTRDADLLGTLAGFHAASVAISLTTLDGGLAKVLEPRASTPARRLAAIRELTDAGVPVHVLTAPIIPGLNDHEIPALLDAAAGAGALAAHYTLVRLPLAVEPIFSAWLERHMPDAKEKILGRIRELRGGALYRGRFGERMEGTGPAAERLHQLFDVSARRAGLAPGRRDLSITVRALTAAHFRVPSDQMTLL